MNDILIYGANGYTALLILDLLAGSAVRPILAGRSAPAIEALAKRHGLPWRAFALDDEAAIARGLEGVGVVLNCAGPFARTAQPMAMGCLRAGAHYLDITGEIEVFERMAALGRKADAAGVMLMPGTGFDVVPSDCLAAHLKRRLPDATRLTLAFHAIGRPSHGTATTMVENLHRGGAVRRGGKIVPVPPAWRQRDIDFGEGPRTAMTIPWGDVATAWHSTHIPDIEVFMVAPAQLRFLSRAARFAGPLLGSGPVQRLLKRQIDAAPAGPDAAARARGRSLLWGEAANAAGTVVTSRLATVEGYTLTALTAWDIALRALAGEAQAGFRTPSMVFGADYILGFAGTTRTDL